MAGSLPDLRIAAKRLQVRLVAFVARVQWRAYQRLGVIHTELGAAAGLALGCIHYISGRPQDAAPMLELAVTILRGIWTDAWRTT